MGTGREGAIDAARVTDGTDRHRDGVRGRRPRPRLEATGREVIHLEIGEPDFDTPANIREAAKRGRSTAARRTTPPFPGIPELREAIAADFDAPRRGIARRPGQRVRHASAARPIMYYAILALVEPGDEVIVPDPGLPDLRA